jgi:hypothetical protein
VQFGVSAQIRVRVQFSVRTQLRVRSLDPSTCLYGDAHALIQCAHIMRTFEALCGRTSRTCTRAAHAAYMYARGARTQHVPPCGCYNCAGVLTCDFTVTRALRLGDFFIRVGRGTKCAPLSNERIEPTGCQRRRGVPRHVTACHGMSRRAKAGHGAPSESIAGFGGALHDGRDLDGVLDSA